MAFHRSVGAKEELSPTLLGVNNMAMKFLPTHLRLLSVISVYREIVAGIKYELLVNAIPEDGERTVCHMEILERPWIVNQWGEKWRKLLAGNCTGESEQPPVEPPQGAFQVNPIFKPSVPQTLEMTEERMRELEMQIIRGNRRKVENPSSIAKPTEDPTGSPPSVTPTEEANSPAVDPNLASGVKEELDKFFQTQTQLGNVNTVPSPATEEVAVNPLQYSTSNSQLENNNNHNEKQEDPQPEIIPIGSPMQPNEEKDKEEDQQNLQQVSVPVFENVPQVANEPAENIQQTVPVTTNQRRRRSIVSELSDNLDVVDDHGEEEEVNLVMV